MTVLTKQYASPYMDIDQCSGELLLWSFACVSQVRTKLNTTCELERRIAARRGLIVTGNAGGDYWAYDRETAEYLHPELFR